MSIMSTEALNNLLEYLREALTYDNRKWLSDKLIEPEVRVLKQMTLAEIDQRIDQSETDIAEGRVVSNDEMMMMIHEFVEKAKKSV